MITASKSQKSNKNRASMRLMIAESVSGILTDPDFGLDIKQTYLRKLKNSVRDKKAGRFSDLKSFLRGVRK
ncbi:MAG TPA: hypothetical protein VJJ24_03020 [Candidatus Paceibacterota bacterium]